MAVGFEKKTVQTAVARREVGDLWEMDTIWAVPVGVRWVSLGSLGLGEDGGVDLEEYARVEVWKGELVGVR